MIKLKGADGLDIFINEEEKAFIEKNLPDVDLNNLNDINDILEELHWFSSTHYDEDFDVCGIGLEAQNILDDIYCRNTPEE